jgi:O-antigen/teichoic acid export membrane protein
MSYAAIENASRRPPQSSVVSQSLWGLAATALQLVAMTLFFILIAHNYSKSDLARFMVANTVYQLVASISNLGLAGWFVRESAHALSKDFPARFLQLQLLSGIAFCILSSVSCGLIYSDILIFKLLLVLSLNIIIDNFTYSIKAVNVSLAQQDRSLLLQAPDAIARLLAVLLAIQWKCSILELVVLQLILRLVVCAVYMSVGGNAPFTMRHVFGLPPVLSELKRIITSNWYFLVLGSISLIYWRVSSLIVFNYLTLHEVADFEVAFRVFSIAQMLPIVVAGSLLSRLVRLLAEQRYSEVRKLMAVASVACFAYGLLAWTAVTSFGGYVIPLVFGQGYTHAAECAAQMCATLLIFPTGMLQATLLTALKLESRDMWFNLFSLVACVLLAVCGLELLERSLWVINMAIFGSFILFHLCQDGLLVRRGFLSLGAVAGAYLIGAGGVVLYLGLQAGYGRSWGFVLFWGLLVALAGVIMLARPRAIRPLLQNL